MVTQEEIDELKVDALEKYQDYLIAEHNLKTLGQGKVPGKEFASIKVQKAKEAWDNAHQAILNALSNIV